MTTTLDDLIYAFLNQQAATGPRPIRVCERLHRLIWDSMAGKVITGPFPDQRPQYSREALMQYNGVAVVMA